MGKTKHQRTRKLAVMSYLLMKKTKRYVPPGIRFILGLVLLIAGFLGFLPILGFWMIPLAVAVLATDIPPLKRWVRARLTKIRAAHKKL